MVLANHYIPLLHMNAASESKTFRILVPLIQDIKFLGGGSFKIFHALHDFIDTGAARAIETARFHLHTGELARFQ